MTGFYLTLKTACVAVLLFIPSYIHAQLSINSTVIIPTETRLLILSLLEDLHNHSGKVSNLEIKKAYLAIFTEEGDYGPMWYGDTIAVNKNGLLITYEYDRVDKKVDRSKIPYQSDDWHSSHSKFIPNDHSAIYSMYICKFGGVPPSFGFSNTRMEWDPRYETIIALIPIQ